MEALPCSQRASRIRRSSMLSLGVGIEFLSFVCLLLQDRYYYLVCGEAREMFRSTIGPRYPPSLQSRSWAILNQSLVKNENPSYSRDSDLRSWVGHPDR